MSKLSKRFIPKFDSLESRFVPAVFLTGNVSVSLSKGVANVVGDSNPNDISVVNNGDGTITLDSATGTTFNGQVGPVTVSVPSLFRLNINMGGGDDSVSIQGGGATVRGNSSIRLGSGDDTLLVDSLFFRDDAKIDGESGDDFITLTGCGFDDDAHILGSAGNDQITIAPGGGGEEITVAQVGAGGFFRDDARIDGGNGDDFITVVQGHFRDDAKILGGAGTDTIQIGVDVATMIWTQDGADTGCLFGEEARVDGGSGADSIDIRYSTFGEEMRLEAGSGNDNVLLDENVFYHDARFNTGDGNDLVTVLGSRFDFDSRFDLGSGNDEIRIGQGSFFNKEARFDGGKGFDTFTHDGTNTWAAKHKVKSFELFQLGAATVSAVADDAFVDEGGSVTIDVLANDATPNGTTIDPASVTIVQDPVNGTATVNADGTISYTHDGSETTFDSFQYVFTNSEGVTSEPATVTVTVNPVNDAPVAADDAFTATPGIAQVLTVLTNDTDAEGPLNVGSVVIVSVPAQGTATPNPDGTVTYTPNVAATGTDTFQYTVQDSDGLTSNIATVTITLVGGGA